MVLLQEDGGPLRLGERRHHALHRPPEVTPHDQLLYALLGRLEGVRLLLLQIVGRRDDLDAPLLPDPVPAQVERDAVEPRREPRLPLEAADGAERAQERLLADVAGVLLTPQRAVREREDRPLPADDQLVERARIAAGGQRHELLVGEVGCCSRGHALYVGWTSGAAYWLAAAGRKRVSIRN